MRFGHRQVFMSTRTAESIIAFICVKLSGWWIYNCRYPSDVCELQETMFLNKPESIASKYRLPVDNRGTVIPTGL